MREICTSGLMRGEVANAPPLLYYFRVFVMRLYFSM
jgi:hypothetical protein